MDSDPSIWGPDVPVHFLLDSCPVLYLCSSSFPRPPAVGGRPPSAPRRLRSNTSGRCLRRGSAPARPARSGTNSTFCAVLRSVCGTFLSGWGLKWHTDGLDSRSGVAPDQPPSPVDPVYDWLGLPSCPTAVRPMGSVQNCSIPVHTVSYRRHHAQGDALPFPPANRPPRPEPLDAPLLPFARRQTAVPLYIPWFCLPAPASSPEATRLEERLEKPPHPLFGVRRGPFCHGPSVRRIVFGPRCDLLILRSSPSSFPSPSSHFSSDLRLGGTGGFPTRCWSRPRTRPQS